jgi:hypothetical protein
MLNVRPGLTHVPAEHCWPFEHTIFGKKQVPDRHVPAVEQESGGVAQSESPQQRAVETQLPDVEHQRLLDEQQNPELQFPPKHSLEDVHVCPLTVRHLPFEQAWLAAQEMGA